jgi:hypothetical protein
VAYIAALPFELNYARLLAGMLAGGIVYFLLSKWLNKAWFEAMRQLMFRTGAQ